MFQNLRPACHYIRKFTRENVHESSKHTGYNDSVPTHIGEVVSVDRLIFEKDSLNDIYKEMALLLGIENAYKIYECFRGQQITFPMKWLSKEYVEIMASKQFDGHNLKSLAREYGYSERWLRQIIRNHIPDDTQK